MAIKIPSPTEHLLALREREAHDRAMEEAEKAETLRLAENVLAPFAECLADGELRWGGGYEDVSSELSESVAEAVASLLRDAGYAVEVLVTDELSMDHYHHTVRVMKPSFRRGET